MTLFEELEGTANRRLQGARCEVRKEVTYRTGGTKGVEGWRKRVREEGAVGGSVAGSTAGWWPSDRDRFPPRFLLPPSLQTHNCIISTHLASSPSPSPSTSLAYSLSFFSTHIYLSLSLSFFTVCQPSVHLLLDPTRCAPSHLRLSSPLVHSTDRPVDRFSLFIVIYPVSSRLSHERVATRAKRPTAFFVLRRFSP